MELIQKENKEYCHKHPARERAPGSCEECGSTETDSRTVNPRPLQIRKMGMTLIWDTGKGTAPARANSAQAQGCSEGWEETPRVST